MFSAKLIYKYDQTNLMHVSQVKQCLLTLISQADFLNRSPIRICTVNIKMCSLVLGNEKNLTWPIFSGGSLSFVVSSSGKQKSKLEGNEKDNYHYS